MLFVALVCPVLATEPAPSRVGLVQPCTGTTHTFGFGTITNRSRSRTKLLPISACVWRPNRVAYRQLRNGSKTRMENSNSLVENCVSKVSVMVPAPVVTKIFVWPGPSEKKR